MLHVGFLLNKVGYDVFAMFVFGTCLVCLFVCVFDLSVLGCLSLWVDSFICCTLRFDVIFCDLFTCVYLLLLLKLGLLV